MSTSSYANIVGVVIYTLVKYQALQFVNRFAQALLKQFDWSIWENYDVKINHVSKEACNFAAGDLLCRYRNVHA